MGTNQWSPKGSGGGGVSVLAYVENTTGVSVTATTEASPQDVVSAGALTFDGLTLVCVEFYSPSVLAPNAVNVGTALNLWDATTQLGRIAFVQNNNAAGQDSTSVYTRRYLTPSAGSHTLLVRAWQTGSGTGQVQGGAGGVSAYMPCYIRVTSGS